jgi:alanine racemase
MPRAWLTIDLAALRANAQALATHAGTRLAPVLKADAYGLGAPAVARALEPLDPWGYCVATPAEGADLRSAGITRPILCCPPMDPAEAPALVAADLQPAIGHREALHAFQRAGGTAWQLAVDTGMVRAGVPWETLHEWKPVLAAHPPTGIFTHFHSADVPDATMADQEHRFAAALAELPARPTLVHTDNSAAAARREPGTARGTVTRSGLFLYGVGTGPTARLHPRPVVGLKARIVELHEVATGDTVGYDGAYTAPGPRRIATVNVGYADGYRRALGNRGFMLVRGRRAPITGWVTMDMTMLDVTECGAELGDIATAIGTDDAAPGVSLGLEALAAHAQCSPYELLVALRLRLPRVYVGA